MQVCCKTCPFKTDKNDRQQDPELASEVTYRTLFNAWQLCHKDGYDKKKELFRCKGSHDYNMEIYGRLGITNLNKIQ